MREYGKVAIRFWQDDKARRLSEKARMFLLYLLTCPHSNPIGCFRLPIAYAADDLQWDKETVTKTLSETVSIGLVEHDETLSCVRLVNYFRYNPIENPNVGKSCVAFIRAIPITSNVYQGLIESLKPFAERFPNGFINGLANRSETVCQTESLNLAQPEPKPEPKPEPEPQPGGADSVGEFQEVFDGVTALFPNLTVKSTSPIRQWLGAGCAPAMILAEVRRFVGRDIGSFAYFTRSIMDAKATLERPPPIGVPRATTDRGDYDRFGNLTQAAVRRLAKETANAPARNG